MRKILILTLAAALLSGCTRHSPYAYLVVLDDDVEILDVGPRYSEADTKGEIPLEYQLERAGLFLQVRVHAQEKKPTGTFRVLGADGVPLPFHLQRKVACRHWVQGMDALGRFTEDPDEFVMSARISWALDRHPQEEIFFKDPETLAMGCISSHSSVITLQIATDETESLTPVSFTLGVKYDGTYSWVDSLIGV